MDLCLYVFECVWMNGSLVCHQGMKKKKKEKIKQQNQVPHDANKHWHMENSFIVLLYVTVDIVLSPNKMCSKHNIRQAGSYPY